MKCRRCGELEAVSGLLCGLCRKENDARPAVRAYQRQEKQPEHDFWRIAQTLLYPQLTYNDLDKHGRFRVTELARRMAGIPYHQAPPELDDEIYAILAALNTLPPEIDDHDQYLLDL